MFSTTQQFGFAVEAQVCKYLVARGLRLIVANYSCRAGEIDLIMQDADTLVFVEVRYRNHDGYGGALESVTKNKQRKIIATAKSYLLDCGLWEKVPCRFDAVIVQSEATGEGRVCWVKDAFWLS